MKNKPADVLYCGIRKEKLREISLSDLDPHYLDLFLHWIKERYRIHIKKDVKGEEPPFTKDSILSAYKFTNVKREHDRQSKYLIQHVSTNSGLSFEDKVVNTFLFRSWNNLETFRDFGLPYSAKKLYNENLKEKIRPLYHSLAEKDPDRLWWSNAYNQGGTKHAWKFPDGDGYQRAYKEEKAKTFPDWEEDIPLRPFHVAVWLKRQNIFERLLDSKDQKECFDVIRSVRGFADFLAYQVFVDLTYIEEFPFSENEFTIAGPGAIKGLKYLFPEVDMKQYSPEELIFWVRDHFRDMNRYNTENGKKTSINPKKRFLDVPEYDRSMNVMSLENCFCEFSKYCRAVESTKRARIRKYDFEEHRNEKS